jgi:hypothetical protein
MMTDTAPPERGSARRSGEIRLGRSVPWRTFNNSILERPDLAVHAKMVYIVLSSHATANDQRCFPSYATIAREASVARRTAIRAIAELATARLLVKTARYRADSCSPTSNLYVLFPADAPFEPDQEGISPDGVVVPLDPIESLATEGLVAAGDSETPGWCPPDPGLVTVGHQPSAPEAPTVPHPTDQTRRSDPESDTPLGLLTRPDNKTKERHGDDREILSQGAHRLASAYGEAAGAQLSIRQARQIIAKYGEPYARAKLTLLERQRLHGGFRRGPLPYFLAALAGNWQVLSSERPFDSEPSGVASNVAPELEARAETLLQAIPSAHQERLREEVVSALAEATHGAAVPDFVVRTELLRRMIQEFRLDPEKPAGGVA